jgi:hypothetical protein
MIFISRLTSEFRGAKISKASESSKRIETEHLILRYGDSHLNVFQLVGGIHEKQKGISSNRNRRRFSSRLGGCNDCHSPKVMTAMGPVPDTTRLLSGHPADEKLPPMPSGVIGPDKWGALTNNSLTAWYGPWGVSFAFNLTPDTVTGIGAWTESAFIKALRTGKHMGAGRPILPPMPWPGIGSLNDDDLGAIFAYPRSLKPIQNQVPLPIPPSEIK